MTADGYEPHTQLITIPSLDTTLVLNITLKVPRKSSETSVERGVYHPPTGGWTEGDKGFHRVKSEDKPGIHHNGHDGKGDRLARRNHAPSSGPPMSHDLITLTFLAILAIIT